MAKKEFTWRGMSLEEAQQLDLATFTGLVGSRARRSLKRGFTPAQKALLKKIRNNEKNIKTHCRDLVILPEMLGKTISVYTGKEFVQLIINLEMLGGILGEYALTRKNVAHSAPGVGATRSSSAISVR